MLGVSTCRSPGLILLSLTPLKGSWGDVWPKNRPNLGFTFVFPNISPTLRSLFGSSQYFGSSATSTWLETATARGLRVPPHRRGARRCHGLVRSAMRQTATIAGSARPSIAGACGRVARSRQRRSAEEVTAGRHDEAWAEAILGNRSSRCSSAGLVCVANTRTILRAVSSASSAA